MKRIVKTKQLDEGMYVAVVSDIVEMDGEWGPWYIWNFLVKDGKSEGEKIKKNVHVSGRTSGKFTAPSKKYPASKLYRWLDACNVDVSEDTADIEECIHEIVEVKVEEVESNNGSIFVNVVDIKRKKRKHG